MLAEAAARYAPDDFDSSDKPLRDTAEASRFCVRKLQHAPVLSAEWFSHLEQLKKLARLVQLEANIPSQSKVLDTAGRNSESEGTLWDQEAHETAIRILVEEAKVNLCLRIIHDLKRWQHSPKKEADILACAEGFKLEPRQIQAKVDAFEEFMGMLLTRALVHVETLQLMDIPLLIEHIAFVLENADKVEFNMKMQETMTLYMFSSLMKHAESLNNSELLAKTREHNLVGMTTNELLKHQKDFNLQVLGVVSAGLAAMGDNEDFKTEWKDFFPDEESKKRFLELEGAVVNRVLEVYPDKKKDLRPLLDLFKTIQRTM
eukprot:TRINITY_DN12343_c0_g1_i4.p1 TRINITY_DN12343_c0_g1~~TRINITY_DN12343_c0_g1_i4.p1  ORF type:complete len:317 (-),score=91.51 TRINITY_DN12343_c0_g1_i4:83-1033(-)